MLSEEEKENIKSEIRSWSREQLEPPNPDFNNIPACPYAKKAWDDKKVKFAFKTELYDNDVIYEYIENWDDSVDLVILVDTNFVEETEDFHDNLDFINENISDGCFGEKDFWVMGFHPYDDANELIDDGSFEGESETEYAIVFIQRLSKLEIASEKLINQGYYKTYFDTYDVSEMYAVRKEFYRRLKDEEVRSI